MSTGTEPGREGPVPTRLGEELEALKQRSGRSYAALAHRTGLSRSTLHRYCQGSSVPGTFGAVESIARACGASDQEVDRLYRTWRATAGRQGPADHDASGDPSSDGGQGVGDPRADLSPEDAPGGQHPAALPQLRTFHWLRAAALLLAFVVTSGVSVTSYPGGLLFPARGAETSQRPLDGDGKQQFRGPLWSITPRPVPAEFMGLTMNTDTGQMPGFRTGSVRFWNSHTRWALIEREPGEYDWKILEKMVKGAERKRLPVLFTFGGTPLWAVKDGRKSLFKDSSASPPDDLKVWDRFVEEVAERYKGRIESYELWDYPSHKGMFADSMATLGRMVERAARIIRRVDPEARVACPSFGHLRSERGRSLLRKFVRTGAADSCDAFALKMPPRKPSGPPEETIELAKDVNELLGEEGVTDMDLWNTGPDIDIVGAKQFDARRARDYAVRFYLSGLFARQWGMRRMYFYNWGSTGLPIVVQPVGGRPAEAGLRMGRLARWLQDASIASCGEGRRSGMADGAYTCRFERDGRTLRVYWTTRGRAEVTLEQGAHRLRHMDGRTARARAGDRISFGEEPVLVEYRGE